MTLRKRADLKEDLLGDELFLTDREGNDLMVLNAVALFIWSMFEDHSKVEMADVLAELFPAVDRETLERDIVSTLDRFREAGLLTESRDNET